MVSLSGYLNRNNITSDSFQAAVHGLENLDLRSVLICAVATGALAFLVTTLCKCLPPVRRSHMSDYYPNSNPAPAGAEVQTNQIASQG